MNALRREPVAVRTAIVAAATALVHVLVVFGVFPDEAEAPVVAVVDTLAGLVLILVLRPAVTPNAKVVARLSVSDGQVVAGDAAAFPAGSVLDTSTTYVAAAPEGARSTREVMVPVDPSLAAEYLPAP